MENRKVKLSWNERFLNEGATVDDIPEGGKEVEINGMKYVKLNDTYYQPIDNQGKSAYQVAEVN